MPEIKFDSDWLKAYVNVSEGDNIRFFDAGEQDKDGAWIFTVGIIKKGTQKIACEKKFSLKKKNFTAIADTYGGEMFRFLEQHERKRILRPYGERAHRVTGKKPQRAGLELTLTNISMEPCVEAAPRRIRGECASRTLLVSRSRLQPFEL